MKQVFSSVKMSRAQWYSRLGHPTTPIIQHILHRHELLKLLFVMPISKARVINYLFLYQLILLPPLLRLYIQMYGALPKLQLVDIRFMLVLLMLIVVLLGSIFLNINLMCSKFFFTFNNMLNAS
jgi:hypothetical protein